jgi:hypothetical protein
MSTPLNLDVFVAPYTLWMTAQAVFEQGQGASSVNTVDAPARR